MGNLLLAPGFETDSPFWTWDLPAERSNDKPNTGAWSAKIRTTGTSGNPEGSVTSAAFVLSPGVLYRLDGWFYPDTGLSSNETFYVEIDRGDGWTELLADTEHADKGEFNLRQWWFVALGSSGQLRFRIDTTQSVAGTQVYVDDLVLDEELGLMFTSTLRTALEADLGDISTGNGFQTDVAAVESSPRDPMALPRPCLIIRSPTAGESAPASLTDRKGECVQTFGVEAWVKETAPAAALDNLLDDVRNAVERSAGNLNGTAGVEWAVVDGWDEREGADDLRNLEASLTLSVSIHYLYSRGSL